jgi:hypothetical protein
MERASMTARVPHFIEADIRPHSVGSRNHVCPHCGARMWAKEKGTGGAFYMCCMNGSVNLADMFPEPMPDLLHQLYTGRHPRSGAFLSNIRAYNSALQFASTGLSLAHPAGAGPQMFTIKGGVYHRIGPMFPSDEGAPSEHRRSSCNCTCLTMTSSKWMHEWQPWGATVPAPTCGVTCY